MTQQLRETSGIGHAGRVSCCVGEPAQAGLSSFCGFWPARGRAGPEPWEMHMAGQWGSLRVYVFIVLIVFAAFQKSSSFRSSVHNEIFNHLKFILGLKLKVVWILRRNFSVSRKYQYQLFERLLAAQVTLGHPCCSESMRRLWIPLQVLFGAFTGPQKCHSKNLVI